MPRVKQFDQKIALGQALELFWKKGYEATSLSDLTTTLKIGKGSFYDTYGSKRALFFQCLSNYQSSSFEVLDELLESDKAPFLIIKELIEMHTQVMLTENSSKGCFIANSTTELSHDEEVLAFLEAHNSKMRQKLANVIKRSSYAAEADQLSDLVLNHLTGISVMSKFVDEPERFHSVNAIFLKVFKEEG